MLCKVEDDLYKFHLIITLYFLGEYEEAKEFEIFRRYRKIKGVIKRCVMYMRLGVLPDFNGSVTGLYVF